MELDVLTRFGLDPIGGFVKTSPRALDAFPASVAPEWLAVESLAKSIPESVKRQVFRLDVSNMPAVSVASLAGEKPLLEWAYVLLSFIAHAYVYGEEPVPKSLPRVIAEPWLEVSDCLGLNPVASYASTVSYNCMPIEGAVIGTGKPDDFKTSITCTGTEDEAWFYQVSAAIDSHSAVFIDACLRLIEQPHAQDEVFDALVPEMRKVTGVLKRIYERCNPETFYFRVRPFLKAWGKGSEAFPLGLQYETDAEGKGPRHLFVGGSASQDPLIQLIDIIAGIRHGTSYLKEMRAYMPREHREFLEWAESRMASCEVESVSKSRLRDAIASFRLVHMSVVRDYIVKPGGVHSVGTGGTDPIPFLRAIIDETRPRLQSE